MATKKKKISRKKATVIPPAQTGKDALLLLTEVAEICRVPIGSVRGWIRDKRLRSIRPGRRVMVRRYELDRFLEDS
ncbi:MAG TPA: helix-turn-helix domain-containing protein [Polyangiaceae bacterium]|nr:helix-turn-helix domain-containing protein [Polyangiaceae bacterium]